MVTEMAESETTDGGATVLSVEAIGKIKALCLTFGDF